MRPGRASLSFVVLAAGLATAVHATETCRLTDEATKACAGTCGPTQLVEYGCVSVDGDVVGNWSTCTRRLGQWTDSDTFTPFPFDQWVPATDRTQGQWVWEETGFLQTRAFCKPPTGPADALMPWVTGGCLGEAVESLRSVTGHFRLHNYVARLHVECRDALGTPGSYGELGIPNRADEHAETNDCMKSVTIPTCSWLTGMRRARHGIKVVRAIGGNRGVIFTGGWNNDRVVSKSEKSVWA